MVVLEVAATVVVVEVTATVVVVVVAAVVVVRFTVVVGAGRFTVVVGWAVHDGFGATVTLVVLAAVDVVAESLVAVEGATVVVVAATVVVVLVVGAGVTRTSDTIAQPVAPTSSPVTTAAISSGMSGRWDIATPSRTAGASGEPEDVFGVDAAAHRVDEVQTLRRFRLGSQLVGGITVARLR